MTDQTRTSARASTLKVALVVAFMLGPATLIVWLRAADDRLSELMPPPLPVLVEVTEHEISESEPAVLSVEFGDTPALLAPLGGGLLRDWLVKPGQTVTDGMPVAVVDDRVVLSVMSERPFWRRLRRGDSGADVGALQAVLGRLGYHDGEIDGSFGPSTATAVKNLASDLGVSQPDGSFEPSWFVWLPDSGFLAVQLLIDVGEPMPGVGIPIIEGSPSAVGSVLLKSDGTSVDVQEGWVFEVDDASVPVIRGTVEDLEPFLNLLDSETNSVNGTVRQTKPTTAIRVPAGAVVAGSGASSCVWVEVVDQYVATNVAVVGGRIGTADVTGDVQAGDRVLANPQLILDTSECP